NAGRGSRSALRGRNTDRPAQWASQAQAHPACDWARRAYYAPVARALIDADKWLTADATSGRLGHRAMCANSPSKVVSTCTKPALLGTAAGNGVRGTAAAWATQNADGVPGGP